MRININKIQDITNIILDSLKKKYENGLELKVDYYWNIEDNEKYNVYKNPSELTIGQISEDYDFLISDIKKKNISYYDLKYISHILLATAYNEQPDISIDDSQSNISLLQQQPDDVQGSERDFGR